MVEPAELSSELSDAVSASVEVSSGVALGSPVLSVVASDVVPVFVSLVESPLAVDVSCVAASASAFVHPAVLRHAVLSVVVSWEAASSVSAGGAGEPASRMPVAVSSEEAEAVGAGDTPPLDESAVGCETAPAGVEAAPAESCSKRSPPLQAALARAAPSSPVRCRARRCR